MRFASVGKQASAILHDLKGLLAAPTIYLDLIDRERDSIPAPLRDVFAGSAHDIARVHEAILTLNKIAVSEVAVPRFCSVAKAVEEAQALLVHRLRMTRVRSSGDALVWMSHGDLVSGLLNAFINALAAHRERGSSVPLEISVDTQSDWKRGEWTITITDNAGGFDPLILEGLRHGRVVSGFKNGTGLGTALMRDAMMRVSGRVDFENSDRGARVVFRIPQRSKKNTARAGARTVEFE